MPDIDNRSIEIVVQNNTRGDLEIQDADIASPGTVWITGKHAEKGTTLKTYATMRIGAKTEKKKGDVNFAVHFSGLGPVPITINAINNIKGASRPDCAGNSAVHANIETISNQDENHLIYRVVLTSNVSTGITYKTRIRSKV